jgi:hypothetical protein
MNTIVEKYTDTKKMKEYVAMAKDLKDSGFTTDEIIELIGKGYEKVGKKMKAEKAKEKICPYLNNNCLIEECMMWRTTIKGKKEIDRKKEPYDMTPMDISNWAKHLKDDGYENIGKCDGFRDNYVKYEETFEGYCTLNKENK